MMSHGDPILQAAAAIVAAGEVLTIAAVAARAGVSRGTVYRRYADRDAILAALGAVEPPEPRERILDAVGRLLKRKGLSATTIDEVAAEAEVGVATVYRRFGDRRGLLQAFLTERTPRRLATALDTGGEPGEVLRQLARENLIFLREYRGLFPLFGGEDPDGLFAELRASSTSVRELTARYIGSRWPDPSGRTIQAFHGLVMAIAWMGEGDAEDDARFIVQSFLHGVSR